MFEQFIHEASSFFVSFYGVILSGLTLDFALKLGVIYGLIIWLAVIIWVIKDITNRTTNILFQVFSILLVVVFTPIFGLPIYLLIRPNTTLFEQYYEESSLENIDGYDEDADIESVEIGLACPHCHGSIENNHKYCPHCRFELMADCISCKSPVHVSWKYCPSCGHDQSEELKTAKKGGKKKEEKVEEVAPEKIEEVKVEEVEVKGEEILKAEKTEEA